MVFTPNLRCIVQYIWDPWHSATVRWIWWSFNWGSCKGQCPMEPCENLTCGFLNISWKSEAHRAWARALQLTYVCGVLVFEEARQKLLQKWAEAGVSKNENAVCIVAVQLRRKLERDPILFLCCKTRISNVLTVFLMFQHAFNRRQVYCILLVRYLLLIYITNQLAIVQFPEISDLRKAILWIAPKPWSINCNALGGWHWRTVNNVSPPSTNNSL